jgi:hypothetical protein
LTAGNCRKAEDIGRGRYRFSVGKQGVVGGKIYKSAIALIDFGRDVACVSTKATVTYVKPAETLRQEMTGMTGSLDHRLLTVGDG